MEGYSLAPSGELTFLGEILISAEVVKEAEKAFEELAKGALKNQFEAIFMSHFLESLPETWNPRCGAIVNGYYWVGGERSADHWDRGLKNIGRLGVDLPADKRLLSNINFPNFWFCCTKEDSAEGFSNLMTEKTFFSDLVANEEKFLKEFGSVYWTRLCHLTHPFHALHLTKTSLYSLTTIKSPG